MLFTQTIFMFLSCARVVRSFSIAPPPPSPLTPFPVNNVVHLHVCMHTCQCVCVYVSGFLLLSVFIATFGSTVVAVVVTVVGGAVTVDQVVGLASFAGVVVVACHSDLEVVLRLQMRTRFEENGVEHLILFIVAVCITFAFSFIPSGIIHFVVKERITGSKQQQIICGASAVAYWLANFTYDLMFYIVPVLGTLLTLHLFHFNHILTGDSGQVLWAGRYVCAACGVVRTL